MSHYRRWRTYYQAFIHLHSFVSRSRDRIFVNVFKGSMRKILFECRWDDFRFQTLAGPNQYKMRMRRGNWEAAHECAEDFLATRAVGGEDDSLSDKFLDGRNTQSVRQHAIVLWQRDRL